MNKDFYVKSLLPMLLFTIVEGFRYARGADYMHYQAIYQGVDEVADSQFLFYYIINILHLIGFNYVGFFMFSALLFICGVFYFIKGVYGNEGKWMYLLAVLAMLLKFECFVRQYLAMPFLLIGLSLMLKEGRKNYTYALMLLPVIALIHSGLLFCVPFFVLFYFFIKKCIPLYVALPVLFATYYLIPKGFFSGTFVDSLNLLMGMTGGVSDNPMGNYVENSDRWLGEDSILEGAEQTPLTMTLQFLFESSLLILSYIALKICPNRKVLPFFNIVFVGFVFCRMFHGYEIFQRLFGQLYIYWFIPAGYGLYILKSLKGKKKLYLNYISTAMLLYLLTFWGRFIFLNPDADYVWNH